jgi:prepilin-type N-terminal cleavage/methylation domain-containing protein/prepilin-type processing-associated H-X9-DG protein
MRNKAFTLIEMLVVIAIIAILAAIITPGLSNARQKADTAKCMNNLKQLGFAVKSYLLEHDNRFGTASARDRYGEIATNYLPYLENEYSLLRCPAQKADLSTIFPNNVGIPNSGSKWISYEFNTAMIDEASLMGKRFVPSFITQPMACAYAYDFPFNPADAAYHPHKNGMNVLYLDWHVAWLPESEYHLGETTSFYGAGHK